MAETLHRPEETQKTFEETADDALAMGNSWEEDSLAAAQSIVAIQPDTAPAESAIDRYEIPERPGESGVPERKTTSKGTYIMRRAAVGVAGIGVIAGIGAGVDTIVNASESEAVPVASQLVYIPQGGTVETSTREAIINLEESGAIAEGRVKSQDIGYEAAVAKAEREAGGQPVQPGDVFLVSLSTESAPDDTSPTYILDVDWQDPSAKAQK